MAKHFQYQQMIHQREELKTEEQNLIFSLNKDIITFLKNKEPAINFAGSFRYTNFVIKILLKKNICNLRVEQNFL